MSATGIAYTVLEIFLATVLATGGVSKIIAPTDWRNGLRSYRVSLLNHHIVCVGVPIAELSIAALLSYDLNPTIPLVAASLFAGFAVVLLLATRRNAQGNCNCLGGTFEMAIGYAAAGRAAGLSALSLLLTLLGLELGARSVLPGQAAAVLGLAAVMLLFGQLRFVLRNQPQRPARP